MAAEINGKIILIWKVQVKNMNKERFFVFSNQECVGQVYRDKMNRQIVILESDIDVNEDINIFSNLTGKIMDKELTDFIIDYVKNK